MTERLRQLKRIAVLREMQERRQEVELLRERARLIQVEGRIKAAMTIGNAASAVMFAGGREDRMIDAAVGAVAASSLPGLRHLLGSCIENVDVSQRKWASCQRETEQALLLGRAVRKQELKEMDRRSQAESDDRFAARKSWLKQRTANITPF